MQPISQETDSTQPEQRDTPHGAKCVQETLLIILQSSPFRTTRQCQDLLRYVVEHTLSGEDQSLRERIIGAQVFGRRPDYDTSEDPVVRIRAADVRKRLAQFYQGIHGAGPAVRIDIPPGSYRATFDWPPAAALQAGDPAFAETIAHTSEPVFKTPERPIQQEKSDEINIIGSTQLRPLYKRSSIWVAASLLLILACGGWYRLTPSRRADADFDRFWSPMLQGRQPILICMGSNVVYQLSHEFMVRYFQDRHLENRSMETYVALPPNTTIPARDLEPSLDSFVALGDVSAASRLVATVTQKGRSYEERFPPDISFAELQHSPAILVGGFNNQLTMTLTKDLRFVLAQNSRIEDRQNRSKNWVVLSNGDARATEDYAIVSWLIDSESGAPVISIAGIGQYGTQAAADFISSPQMIHKLMSNAPAGWSGKNLQVVLHVKVIDFRPISTDMVANYYW
jgi:hypothetical protein